MTAATLVALLMAAVETISVMMPALVFFAVMTAAVLIAMMITAFMSFTVMPARMPFAVMMPVVVRVLITDLKKASIDNGLDFNALCCTAYPF